MRPSATSPGRTYKFYTGQAIYQFGDGMSYTTFKYTYIDQIAALYRAADGVEEYDIADVVKVSSTINGLCRCTLSCQCDQHRHKD